MLPCIQPVIASRHFVTEVNTKFNCLNVRQSVGRRFLLRIALMYYKGVRFLIVGYEIYFDYNIFSSHSSTVIVTDEKFTPIHVTLRESV